MIACLSYSSFGQILEEYVPENLDAFKSDTIKYQVNADGYVDVKSIPRPDCEVFYKIANHYYFNADKIIVIPEGTDKSSELERITNEYSRSYKNCVFKKETELSNTDFQKLLILNAPIHYYKDWSKFNLPILQEEKGFSFLGQKYTDENDGVFYMSSDIIAITGNSFTPIWNLFNSYCVLYKYVLINDNTYVKYGLLNGHEINLEKIRTANYNSVISKYFQLDISKSLGATSTEYDMIVEPICETLDLELPRFRIHCMVHSGPNEARLFSNWFALMGCDILADSVIFGAAHNGVIHVIGEDKGLISHESFHAIWDKLIGIRNTFFAEGIQMYYEFICDTSKITAALDVMKKHKEYDLKSLIITGNNFFNGPNENNRSIAYPISGLFSMYLIEKYGLEKYKLLFKAEKGENGFTEVYELKLDIILADFYSWIDSK